MAVAMKKDSQGDRSYQSADAELGSVTATALSYLNDGKSFCLIMDDYIQAYIIIYRLI